MNELIKALVERKFELLQAIYEHLQISLLALLIAIFVSVPIAVLISNKQRLTSIVLQVAGVFQTIPSLALLGLFIPLFGIGTFSAVVALVIYSLFPILQNTITGLKEINPSLKEAAAAFGMTRLERLRKFELALAMPVIIAGIRTAAVSIIGAATLAALIGAGGLGSFVLLGIDRNNTSLILIGAIFAAALAIIFSFAIGFLQRQNIKVAFFALIAMFLSVLLPSFLGNMSKKDNLIIAAKLGTEPEILINMYKFLIENNSDIKVDLKPNFGKTTFLFEALKNKNIDIYPEFSGTIVSGFIKNNNLDLGNDERFVYEFARDEIYKQDKLIFLEPMAYQNTYALAASYDFAKKYNLQNISDLNRVRDKIKAGFTLEFNDRKDGNSGLKSLYGLNIKAIGLEPSLRYKAILNKDVNLINAFSTDSEIREYNLKVLSDDKKLFPPYQGAPLLREETLKKYPELKNILEKLANKISNEDMINMNYEVKFNGRKPSDVARNYLIEKSILRQEK